MLAPVFLVSPILFLFQFTGPGASPRYRSGTGAGCTYGGGKGHHPFHTAAAAIRTVRCFIYFDDFFEILATSRTYEFIDRHHALLI